MTAEVVSLPTLTTLDLSPDAVLDAAKGQLDRVVVVGISKAGHLYVAASDGEGFAKPSWLLTLAQTYMASQELDDLMPEP